MKDLLAIFTILEDMTSLQQKYLLKSVIALITTITTIVLAAFYFLFLDLASFWFGLSLNFLLFIWIVIVESQLKPKLDSTYFDCHSFEMNGRIYSILGVHVFRRFLLLIGWESQRKKTHPVCKRLAALEKVERMTRTSELGHLVVGVVMVGIIIGVGITHSWRDTRYLICLNILLNVYPILLQRYNRPRVKRVLKQLRLQEPLPKAILQ